MSTQLFEKWGALLVPAPPSANHLYVRTRGGQARSAEYKAWLQNCGWLFIAERCPKFAKPAPLGVSIEAHVSRRRDVDNLIKPILDLLEAAGGVEDDRYVDEVFAARRSAFTSDRAAVLEPGWARVRWGRLTD